MSTGTSMPLQQRGTGELLPPELEQRLREVEEAAAREPGFTGLDWAILIGTGIVFPIVLLVWGWPT